MSLEDIDGGIFLKLIRNTEWRIYKKCSDHLTRTLSKLGCTLSLERTYEYKISARCRSQEDK